MSCFSSSAPLISYFYFFSSIIYALFCSRNSSLFYEIFTSLLESDWFSLVTTFRSFDNSVYSLSLICSVYLQLSFSFNKFCIFLWLSLRFYSNSFTLYDPESHLDENPNILSFICCVSPSVFYKTNLNFWFSSHFRSNCSYISSLSLSILTNDVRVSFNSSSMVPHMDFKSFISLLNWLFSFSVS